MPRRKPFPANRHSIKKLEAEGWCVATVEQTIPHCFIKRDFCNFADLIAFCPSKGIMAVQVTGGKSSSNGLARLRKIKAEPRAGLWLASGGRIQVHDWRGIGTSRKCFVTELFATTKLCRRVGRRKATMNTETQSPHPVGSSAWLAEQIARKAHANQFRRDGVTPYITHPEAVANKLKSEGDEAVAVAWLHDVLEDTKMTPECLRAAGIPMTVIDAVCDLKHQRDEPYADYLEWIKRNPLAVKVKVADMLHNLSDAPTQKQIVKYARGLLALLG